MAKVETSNGMAPAKGSRATDGAIYTGFYKNFQELSDDYKQPVFDELHALISCPRKKIDRRGSETSAIKPSKLFEKLKSQIASLRRDSGKLKLHLLMERLTIRQILRTLLATSLAVVKRKEKRSPSLEND